MRQVAHVLLTRPPLNPFPKELHSLDLHVLGTPPAFVLSQDQTLMFNSCYAPDFLWLAFSLNSLTACVLAFLALYRFQGSLLSSELVHHSTVPLPCQHLFSNFLTSFLESCISRTF